MPLKTPVTIRVRRPLRVRGRRWTGVYRLVPHPAPLARFSVYRFEGYEGFLHP